MRTNPDNDVDASNGVVADSTGFLRRFADMMSHGANARNLHQTADLVEHLAQQLTDAERRAGHAERTCDTYRDLCTTADLAVRDMQSRITALQQRIQALEDEKAALVAKGTDERQRLSAVLAEAEFSNETIGRELASRTAELEALSACTAVSGAMMSAILNQFNSIADECESTGNIVLATMCQIGRRLTERAIAGTRTEAI